MHRRKTNKRRPLYIGLAVAVIASGVAVAANATETGGSNSVADSSGEDGQQKRVLAEAAPTDQELLDECGKADVCTYTVNQTSRFLGPQHTVGSVVVNCESSDITRNITWSDTTQSSTNINLNLSVGGGFEQVLNASFSASLGFGFQKSHSTSESFTETLKPHTISEVVRATAMVQTIGDWELHFPSRFRGHFIWFDKNVSFATEDPSGNDLLIFRQRSLTQADIDEFCAGQNILPPEEGFSEERVIQDSELSSEQVGVSPSLEPGDAAEGEGEGEAEAQ